MTLENVPYLKAMLSSEDEDTIVPCRWITGDWCLTGSSGPLACCECLTKKTMRARKRRCDLAKLYHGLRGKE